MEQTIVNLIADAEAEAAQIKAQAVARAAVIAKQAEAEAAQIARQSESELKAYRERVLREAEEKAQESYLRALEESRVAAREKADEILGRTDAQVAYILGRVTK